MCSRGREEAALSIAPGAHGDKRSVILASRPLRFNDARRPPASLPRRSARRRSGHRPDRARLPAPRRLHPRRRRRRARLDGRQDRRPSPVRRRRRQDEPVARRRGRCAARRLAVHPLWRRREGPAAELHRRGAARDGDPVVRTLPGPAARPGRSRGDGRVRRDDGRRARERRASHPAPGTMTALRVILASQSPRRRELLALVGITHEVRPADIDETYLPGEHPKAHAERLARGKAATIAVREPDAVIIGSDTIVVVDGDVLGKPAHEAEAARMLERLSGRAHTVVTAVAVAWRGETRSAVEEVGVEFHPLSRHEIAAYIATREPMDKAGAYGIQGYGATIVSRVDGDYFAVMGLPVQRLIRVLGELGIRYAFGPLDVAPA